MQSFTGYCHDYLDLDPALMNDEQMRDARKAYSKAADDSKIEKTPYEIAQHNKKLEKAKQSRKLAKFYGGKALTGTVKQKAWAEDIRQKFLESDATTDEEKKELVTCGGFTDTAKFWIENRDVKPNLMNARNIVAQYQAFREFEDGFYNILARTASASEKNKARASIKDYLKKCDFNFESNWDLD